MNTAVIVSEERVAAPATVSEQAEQSTTINPLPDVPSTMLRAAAADLKSCEHDPQVKVQMQGWLDTRRGKPLVDDLFGFECAPGKVTGCNVCLGAAHLLRSGGYNFKQLGDYQPSHDNDAGRKVMALNAFRTGRMMEALFIMQIEPGKRQALEPIPVSVTSFPAYDHAAGADNTPFYDGLERMAAYLEQHGL